MATKGAGSGGSRKPGKDSRSLALGTIVKLLLAMVLLGIVVGLGIRYAGALARPTTETDAGTGLPEADKKGGRDSPGPGDKRPDGQKDTSGAGTGRTDKGPAIDVPDIEVVPAEEQRAVALIERARAAFPEMAFEEAHKLCGEAALLRASRETRRTAKELGDKAGQFQLAVSHIQVCEFARVETTWVLEMRGGRRLRGMIGNEQPETLVLTRIPFDNPATMGRARLTIPRAEIEKRRKVSLAERQNEFLALLERLERGLSLGPDPAADAYYDLVILGRRLDVRDKCLAYLEAARAKLPDGAVGAFFRGLTIDREIDRATVLAMAGKRVQAEDVLRELTTRTLPGYAPASDAAAAFRAEVLSKVGDVSVATITLKPVKTDDAKPKTARQLVAGAEFEVAVTGVSSSKPAANKLCQRANHLFTEAMGCQRRSRETSGKKCDTLLKEAAAKLEECVDRYGQAYDLDPANKAIEEQQRKANMMLYGIRFKTARMGMR